MDIWVQAQVTQTLNCYYYIPLTSTFCWWLVYYILPCEIHQILHFNASLVTCNSIFWLNYAAIGVDGSPWQSRGLGRACCHCLCFLLYNHSSSLQFNIFSVKLIVAASINVSVEYCVVRVAWKSRVERRINKTGRVANISAAVHFPTGADCFWFIFLFPTT